MSCQEPSPTYISVGELAWELRVWLLSSCSCLEHPLPTSPDSHLPVICIIRKLQYLLGHTADFCCFTAAPQIRTPRSREIDWGIYTPWKLQSSCPHICLSCFSVCCCIFIENGGGNADPFKCWDVSFSLGRWHRKYIAFISFGSGASYFLRGIFLLIQTLLKNQVTFRLASSLQDTLYFLQWMFINFNKIKFLLTSLK